MTTVFVMVGEARACEPDEVALAKHEHMLEEFSTEPSDPTFRDAILPRTAVSVATRLYAHRLHDCHDCGSEDGITVEDEVPRCGVVRKRFSQLLDNLRCCRVERGVTVQNASPAMLYHEEYVEYFERDRGNGKEIHRRDGSLVVTQKGDQALQLVGISGTTRHVA